MAVPNTFGTATSAIPLSQLDANFNTPITLGNTAIQLGDTVTTLNNMTLANVTISSGNVTITNVAITTANVSGTANISTLVVVGNATVGGNTTITGNITATNANVTTNLVLSGGTANGVAYLNTSKVLTTGSALVFDGSQLNVSYADAAYNAGLRVTNTTNNIASQAKIYAVNNAGDYISLGRNSTLLGGQSAIFATGNYPLEFFTDSTLRMTLTGTSLYTASTIDVGIGTSLPGAKLEVNQAATTFPGFKITGSNSPGMQIVEATGVTAHFVNDSAGVYVGSSTSYPLVLRTNNTERARFNTTGALVFNGGTTTADGIGITFPATQSASSNANTLDDYEEGTWTPAWVADTGTLGSITYENRQGTYTKVGRMVTVQGGFYNSAFAAGTGSGDLKISGLPFANGSATVGSGSISDVRLWLVNNPCAMQVGVSASSILLYYKTTANGAINNLQVSDASNGAATNLVYFTITYQV